MTTAIAAPITRNQATVCGATSSNNPTAMTAPMYWATAERTNSASGCAVFSQRVTGPVDPIGGVAEPDRAYSKSSGSDWEISSHIGWKLNQPAAWKPVLACV